MKHVRPENDLMKTTLPMATTSISTTTTTHHPIFYHYPDNPVMVEHPSHPPKDNYIYHHETKHEMEPAAPIHQQTRQNRTVTTAPTTRTLNPMSL